MEKHPTVQSSPDAGYGPRPSLKRARLALIAMLGLLAVAGTGLISTFVWSLVALLTSNLFTPFQDLGPFLVGIATFPSIALSLLGLLVVLVSHLRGTTLTASTSMAAAALLTLAMLAGWLAEFSFLSAISIATAIVAFYLLYARSKRLHMPDGTAGSRQWEWRGGAAISVALLIGAAIVTLIDAINNELSNQNIFLVKELLLISFILSSAVWLLLPLTLMASDSHLILRQRRRQEEQASI